jgi:hypothetical protein
VSWGKVQSFGRELVADPLTRAFAISLLLHFAGIAGVELGKQMGWWDRSLFSSLLKHDAVTEMVKTAQQRAELQKKLLQQQPPPEAELTFVDVDPSQAVAEPPKDSKFYSKENTVASNRSKDSEKPQPKIDGKQDKVAKVTEVSRPAPKKEPAPAPPPKEQSRAEVMRPTPAPPQTPTPQPTAEEPKPAKVEKGETLLAKVLPRDEPATRAQEPKPNNPPPEEPPRKRPRTVAEAMANKGLIQGPKMQQHGGARIGLAEGLDVKATPFGAYDAMFIEAVQSRWFDLLEQREFVGNQAGRVVVEFRLHQDGRITDLSVSEASVSELLAWFCQRAILDPSPYHPFPSDLKRMMNGDYREIRFTFYYNQ